MNSQILRQSSKLPFFYRNLPIILGVIIIIMVVGRAFAWQYFRAPPEEEVKVSGEAVLEVIEYDKERLPRFEDFPVKEIFKDVPALVDFLRSDPGIIELPVFYREHIIRRAEEGPNFAGYYAIVTWGCGTMCQANAVVNAKTGVVRFGPATELGSEFRIDSNLFIVNPPEAIKATFANYPIPDWVYSAYYKWENNQFINIYDTRNADWRVYRNEKYGYEVKHPKNWQLDLRGVPSHISFDVNRDNFLTFEELKIKYGQHITPYYFRFITLDDIRIRGFTSFDEFTDVKGCKQCKNLNEWIEKRMEESLILKNSKKEIVVNKYKGIEVEEIGYGSFRSIFLVRGPFIYNFEIDTVHDEMALFNQMLSTFRFLE